MNKKKVRYDIKGRKIEAYIKNTETKEQKKEELPHVIHINLSDIEVKGIRRPKHNRLARRISRKRYALRIVHAPSTPVDADPFDKPQKPDKGVK